MSDIACVAAQRAFGFVSFAKEEIVDEGVDAAVQRSRRDPDREREPELHEEPRSNEPGAE